MHDLDPVLVGPLTFALIELHRLAERHRVTPVGAGNKYRFAKAPVAMADHRNSLTPGLEAVAYWAVADDAIGMRSPTCT